MTTRRRRGYTLIELVVVAVLSAILLATAVRWVNGVFSASTSGLQSAAVHRNVTYASAVLRRDISSAVVCDPAGLGVPLEQISPSEIGVYAASGGVVNLILWQVSTSAGATVLQRAVISGSGCAYNTSAPAWATIASGLVAPTAATPAFTALGPSAGGNQATAQSYSGPCTGTAAANCLDTSIQVNIQLQSAGRSGAPAALDQTYPLNLTGSQLQAASGLG